MMIEHGIIYNSILYMQNTAICEKIKLKNKTNYICQLFEEHKEFTDKKFKLIVHASKEEILPKVNSVINPYLTLDINKDKENRKIYETVTFQKRNLKFSVWIS